MKIIDLDNLKYPIGKFVVPSAYTFSDRENYINDIEIFPVSIEAEVKLASDQLLDTPYRPEGWTVRQVVHHCSDSHMNALLRFKFTLTENKPTIKPYPEAVWADLADTKIMPIEPALLLLKGLHARWAVLLKSMSEVDFSKKYIHPEYKKEFTLNEALALYAWHCNHHLGHVQLVTK